MVSSSAAAQNRSNPTELNVAVTLVPPFVMQHNGALTGFNIELWNAIAARLNLKTNYQIVPGGGALEEATRSKAPTSPSLLYS